MEKSFTYNYLYSIFCFFVEPKSICNFAKFYARFEYRASRFSNEKLFKLQQKVSG